MKDFLKPLAPTLRAAIGFANATSGDEKSPANCARLSSRVQTKPNARRLPRKKKL
jgi:hypothetical protein